jgi:hypothetical protein
MVSPRPCTDPSSGVFVNAATKGGTDVCGTAEAEDP